eukprot:7217264-Prymnesium_polylepis.1
MATASFTCWAVSFPQRLSQRFFQRTVPFQSVIVIARSYNSPAFHVPASSTGRVVLAMCLGVNNHQPCDVSRCDGHRGGLRGRGTSGSAGARRRRPPGRRGRGCAYG